MFFPMQDDRISAKCRNAKVEDLWSLTSFFGYCTQTFVLAVNLLDRFLAMMKVSYKIWVIQSTYYYNYFTSTVFSTSKARQRQSQFKPACKKLHQFRFCSGLTQKEHVQLVTLSNIFGMLHYSCRFNQSI